MQAALDECGNRIRVPVRIQRSDLLGATQPSGDGFLHIAQEALDPVSCLRIVCRELAAGISDQAAALGPFRILVVATCALYQRPRCVQGIIRLFEQKPDALEEKTANEQAPSSDADEPEDEATVAMDLSPDAQEKLLALFKQKQANKQVD